MPDTNQSIVLSTDGYHDFKSQAWLLAAYCAALPYKLTHIYNLAANTIGHKTLNGLKNTTNDDGGRDKVYLRDYIERNSPLGELISFCNAWESLALYGPKSAGFEHLNEYTDKALLGLAEYLSLCDEETRVRNWSETDDNMHGIVETGDSQCGVSDAFLLDGRTFPDLNSLDVACNKELIRERKKFAEIYI